MLPPSAVSPRHRWSFLLAAVLAAGLAVGCASEDDDAATSTTARPPRPVDGAVNLKRVVTTLEQPTAAVVRPGDEDALYVAQQPGSIVRVDLTGPEADPSLVYDLTDRVQSGGEQGLLGIAFNADGSEMYVSYNEPPKGRSVIQTVAMDGESARGDAVTLLTLDQPFANHNGGNVVLGPDGQLWIGFGDGGSAGDPNGNGQNPATLLGSILRISPLPIAEARAAAEGDRYTVPDDNPGLAAPEVFIYGARNPWKFTFDSDTKDLWIGDVGQGDYEEIDVLRASDDYRPGANLGWNRYEGVKPYPPGPDLSDEDRQADVIWPVHVYDHSDGDCSVTGGVVYRGSVKQLQGRYVYADFCATDLYALDSLPQPDEGTSPDALRGRRPLGVDVVQVSALATDAKGELYVFSLDGSMWKVTAN